ncbi:unnamed protein product [Blepharisma stoltei]|uniref:LAGLIDADG homing endonuclease n=1 Tax=Blepharisma stoltei TaxID=1481888 RepID=A0AAU9INL3_9CILI|nr:unnamed protein product [Blepharisma stoltei]
MSKFSLNFIWKYITGLKFWLKVPNGTKNDHQTTLHSTTKKTNTEPSSLKTQVLEHKRKVKFLLGFTLKKGENYIEVCLLKFDHEAKRSSITGWGNNHKAMKRQFTINLIKNEWEVFTTRPKKSYKYTDGLFARDFCFWMIQKAIHYWNRIILTQRIAAAPEILPEGPI